MRNVGRILGVSALAAIGLLALAGGAVAQDKPITASDAWVKLPEAGATSTVAAGSGGYGAEITGATITVSGSSAINIGTIKAASSSSERIGQVISAINAKTADTGLTAFLSDDGKSVQFRSDKTDSSGKALTVTVSGAVDTFVNVSIREADGGTLTAHPVDPGRFIYTAPARPGTYHVVATSRADPGKTGVAEIQVQ